MTILLYIQVKIKQNDIKEKLLHIGKKSKNEKKKI